MLFAERKLYRTVAFLVVLTFSLLCLIVPLLNPVDNWDMLGYAAAVKSLYGMNAEAIHSSVFSEYQSYATEKSFVQLTANSSYRFTMYQDAEAFYQQIPFYKIRILFVLMLAAASELGFDIFQTMHFFSTFFAAAAFLTIYYGMRHQVHSFAWIIAPAFYFFFSLEFEIFETGGVDTFAFFWVAATAVAFFHGSRWLHPLLAITVLVRTDLILYIALMHFAALFWNRADWRFAVIWIPITLAAYFSVGYWSQNYGWTALINFVFESNMLATHPEQYSKIPLEIKQYLGFVYSKYDWISKWFWVAIIFSLLNLVFFIHDLMRTRFVLHTNDEQLIYIRKLQTLSAIFLTYIVLHYLLFPAVFMRFFFGQCFFISLALLATTAAIISAHSKKRLTIHSNKQVIQTKA